jgi:dipeptidase E
MRLPLTSAKITNESIREALVDLLGQSIAESKAICIPTAIKETDGEVEVVSEGEWKLFDKRQSR